MQALIYLQYLKQENITDSYDNVPKYPITHVGDETAINVHQMSQFRRHGNISISVIHYYRLGLGVF